VIASVPRDVASSVRWQAAPNLLWTRYDDGSTWVVYNPASSDIHQLTDAAHELFGLIDRGRPATSETLTAELAAILERAPDDELAAVTRDTLAFMDGAGLIRPVLS